MGVEYVNTNIYYIGNRQNDVYGGKLVPTGEGTEKAYAINTGWHAIPNQFYFNFLTPRQWHDLTVNHSTFSLDRVEICVQNMIPLTDNLSIAQDTTFMTFNNTIYALAFQDNSYETAFVEENTNLLWREGVSMKQDTKDGPVTVEGKLYLPIYTHYLPAVQVNAGYYVQGIYGWDPMVHANTFQELRPGKNSVCFSWKASESHIIDTSIFTAYQSYGDISGRVNFNTGSTDYANLPLTPSGKFRNSSNFGLKHKNSTNMGMIREQYYWTKPIPNMMIKMLPIFDSKGSLLKHEGIVVLTRKIYFNVTPRRGGINYPILHYGYTTMATITKTLNDKMKSSDFAHLAWAPANRTNRPPEIDPSLSNVPYVTKTTVNTDTTTTSTVTTARR